MVVRSTPDKSEHPTACDHAGHSCACGKTVDGAPLLSVAKRSNTQAKSEYNQRLRHSFQKSITTYDSIKKCQTFCVDRDEQTGEVELSIVPGERAGVHGLNCCRNRYCTHPGCSRRRDLDARAQTERLVTHFMDTGTVVFTTFTVSNREIEPRAQIKRMSAAWKATMTGSTRKKLERDFGCVGYLRIMETPIHTGDGHLHPHYHVAYCCDRKLSEEQIEEMGEYLLRRWTRGAERQMLDINRRGQDYKKAYSKDLAAYLCKLGPKSGAGLAAELHLERNKSGRGHDAKSVSWWYLLALAQEAQQEGRAFDTARLIAYYQAFEQAVKGQHTYAVSQSLKALHDELCEAEEAEQAEELPDPDELDESDQESESISLPGHVVRALLTSDEYAPLCWAVTHSEAARGALRALCVTERGRWRQCRGSPRSSLLMSFKQIIAIGAQDAPLPI